MFRILVRIPTWPWTAKHILSLATLRTLHLLTLPQPVLFLISLDLNTQTEAVSTTS